MGITEQRGGSPAGLSAAISWNTAQWAYSWGSTVVGDACLEWACFWGVRKKCLRGKTGVCSGELGVCLNVDGTQFKSDSRGADSSDS